MKKLLGVVLILIFLSPTSYAEKINGHEVEWKSGATYTLTWSNPSVTKEGYEIKVVDFDWKGNAAVYVTHQGETQKGILSQGENIIFDFTKNTTFQGVKIYAKRISHYALPINIGTYPCCPAAEIEVWIAKEIEKKPKLELKLSIDWDGRLGHTSNIKLKIMNKGDAAFSEGNVTINLNGLEVADEHELSLQALSYTSEGMVVRRWGSLLPNNSFNVTLSVKSPLFANKSSFTINVEACFKDFKGKLYRAKESKTVKLQNTLKIKKSITNTILGKKTYGDIKVFGLGGIAVVNIYVKNIQSYPLKSVVLEDTIIKFFRVVNDSITPPSMMENNTKLQWIFDIDAGETKQFSYKLIPQKTGSFTAPPAIARWKEWGATKTASSNTPTTKVYGVFVVISKSIDKHAVKQNESFNITVTLENIGDFPAGINVTDILPENSTLVKGNTTFSGYLLPKEIVSFNYSLYLNTSGKAELPSPQVSFWKKEYEGEYGFIPAESIIISSPPTVNATSITITPLAKVKSTPVIIRKTQLEGVLPLLMLLIAMILMLILYYYHG